MTALLRILCVALLTVTFVPGLALAATLNTDINSYVLFGLESISVKGRNTSPTRGFILGGNIGVNRKEPNTNNWMLSLGANGVVVTSDGSQVVADSIRADQADVYDLFVNRLNSNSPGNLRGAQATFSAPIINGSANSSTFTITGDLPAFPFTPNRALTNNAADVTVNNNLTASLVPGAYRDILLKDGSTLNLTDGTYDLRNMDIGKDVTINVTDNTLLHIDRGFLVNWGVNFGIATQAGAKIYVGAYGLTGSNDTAVKLGSGGAGHQSTIYAQLYCPFGDFNMGNHSNLFGRFWARNISDDFNTNVTYMVPEPASIALLAGMASLLLRFRPTSRNNIRR